MKAMPFVLAKTLGEEPGLGQPGGPVGTAA